MKESYELEAGWSGAGGPRGDRRRARIRAARTGPRDSQVQGALHQRSETSTRKVVVNTPPDYPYGSCAHSWTERIRFRSTEPVTAYVFTSKAHGRARVAWSPLPTFTHNLAQVEVPGEVTVSRSAVYRQTNYVDPDTGETVPGRYNEVLSPVDCAVERTFPATLSHRRHVR
jgi:hypothetical protein